VLIDVQNGITDQTRRHSLVASFLGIGHIVIAINKMDLVNYDEAIFTAIRNDYRAMAEKLGLQGISFIPMSALLGDNVSFLSEKMPWYRGNTLMQYLENCEPVSTHFDAARFSVQYIIDEAQKGLAGKMLSGVLTTGDEVMVLPERKISSVKRIVRGYDEATEAAGGENVVVYLSDGVGARRGDLIAHAKETPVLVNRVEATICWLDAEHDLQPGRRYFLRINAQETTGTITDVQYKTDINTFEQYNDGSPVAVNEFARVIIETTDQLSCDSFSKLPENGRGIIIDAETNYTAGAFVIV